MQLGGASGYPYPDGLKVRAGLHLRALPAVRRHSRLSRGLRHQPSADLDRRTQQRNVSRAAELIAER